MEILRRWDQGVRSLLVLYRLEETTGFVKLLYCNLSKSINKYMTDVDG